MTTSDYSSPFRSSTSASDGGTGTVHVAPKLSASEASGAKLHAWLPSKLPHEHGSRFGWLSAIFLRRSNDDEDDPPPCPAVIGPFPHLPTLGAGAELEAA